MARLLKKISLHDGDILLIRKDKFSEQEIMFQIKRGVENLNVKHVLAIVVDEHEDIRALNHQEMNKNGWYHIDQLNRLTSGIRKET